MKELDPVERALALARGGLSVPEGALERVWQKLPPDAAPVVDAPRGWSALKATGASGVVAAAVLVGGGFGLGFWARGEARPAPADVASALPSSVVQAPPPPAALPASESAASAAREPLDAELSAAREAPVAEGSREREALVADVDAEPAPSPRPRATARRETKPASDAARAELALLQRVERALRNEDGALALALLGELEQRFPRTALGEERRAARLMAHCVRKRDGAEAAAREFLSQHPTSVYQGRLRSLCKITAGEGRASDDGDDRGGH